MSIFGPELQKSCGFLRLSLKMLKMSAFKKSALPATERR
jgi:hypothetical protein